MRDNVSIWLDAALKEAVEEHQHRRDIGVSEAGKELLRAGAIKKGYQSPEGARWIRLMALESARAAFYAAAAIAMLTALTPLTFWGAAASLVFVGLVALIVGERADTIAERLEPVLPASNPGGEAAKPTND